MRNNEMVAKVAKYKLGELSAKVAKVAKVNSERQLNAKKLNATPFSRKSHEWGKLVIKRTILSVWSGLRATFAYARAV